jgi:hypothetical protein
MTNPAVTNKSQGSRSVSEIRRQLADLAEVRRVAESYGTPDFASQVGLESLTLHQESLHEELRAAEMLESGTAIELVLDGDPVTQHSIQASFLGTFLAKVQYLVNAMAQAMTSVPTARAPLPRNIVAENRLMVSAGFVPSSFGIRCSLPSREELEQLYEPVSQDVVDAISEFLSDDLPPENLTGLLSHARVKKHYFELLEILAKNGANLKVRTKNRPYGVKLHTRQARERVEWLELLQTTEERFTFSGILIGGNIETARFELKVGDELIMGKASDAVRAQLKHITFGAQVVAEVRVTTMVHEEAVIEPKASYFLVSIRQEGSRSMSSGQEQNAAVP